MKRMDWSGLGQSTTGFTLVEVLAVIVMVGVLAAIATPSWVAFNERQRLNAANNQIYQALRQAQNQAKLRKEAWQASFRQKDGKVQWAVNRDESDPDKIPWQDFPGDRISESIQINTGTNGTNLPSPSSGFFRLLFNYKGCPVSASGYTCTNSDLSFPSPETATSKKPRIILSNKNGSPAKRCIKILTPLGSMVSAQDEDC